MRKRTVCIVCIVLMLCCLLKNSASAEKIILQEPTDYSREFYLTQAQSVETYNDILRNFVLQSDSAVGRTVINDEEDDEIRYPDYYGGAYIEEATGELIVMITEDSEYIYENINMCTDGEFKYEICDVSYNEMTEIIEKLSEQIEYFDDLGIEITSIQDDILGGVVQVGVNELTERKADIITEVIGCDFLQFVEGENETEVAVAGGGHGIVSTNNGASSTIGFAATRGGVEGWVIAGHAVNAIGEGINIHGTALIGTAVATAYRNDSTADAAFIRSNGFHIPTNALARTGCYILGASTLDFPVNTVVYMLGNVSGLTSGRITSTNATTRPSDDIILLNQTRATYASVGGDSGAPILFYDGNFGGKISYTLLGIHHGTGASGKYFSKYSEIVEQLGVRCIVE